jgi:hypothetical protein
MRDQWYADNRDLVKWGALVHLAEQYGIQIIVQVAYYRADDKITELIVDDQPPVKLPSGVWKHFRNLELIRSLENDVNIKIDVLNDPFERTEAYHQNILNRIEVHQETKIVFLDPDTGLAPKKPKLEHVLKEELQHLWNSLRKNDWLVLYQHKWRDKDWRRKAEEEFKKVCTFAGEFHSYRSERPSNVMLLCAKKSGS